MPIWHSDLACKREREISQRNQREGEHAVVLQQLRSICLAKTMSSENAISDGTSESVLATYEHWPVGPTGPSAFGMIISFVTYILLRNENNKSLNLIYQILEVDSLMSMMGNFGIIMTVLSGRLETPNTFLCICATTLILVSAYSLFANDLLLACPR